MTVGIDEAGRGCVAGSLYIVAVGTPKIDISTLGITDSKKLSKKKRNEIFSKLEPYFYKEIPLQIKRYTPIDIDDYGLSRCYKNALEDIYFYFGEKHDFIFDGNTLYGADVEIKTETKAESKFLEVSLASIIAKVLRDKEIENIAQNYPQYNWEKHNGYINKYHKEVLEKYGPIKGIHRFSWKPVQECLSIF